MKKRTKKQKQHAQRMHQLSAATVTQVGSQYSYQQNQVEVSGNSVTKILQPVHAAVTDALAHTRPQRDLTGKELFPYDTKLIFQDLRKTLVLVVCLFAVLIGIYSGMAWHLI